MAVVLNDPLQVALCYHAADSGADLYDRAVNRAFCGGDDFSAGYLAGGEDLNVPMRVFRGKPNVNMRDLVPAPLHMVFIVLLGEQLLRDHDYLDWLNDAFAEIAKRRKSHRVLLVFLDDVRRRFWSKCPQSKWIRNKTGKSTFVNAGQLGERAARPAVCGMMALHLARDAVSAAYGSPSSKFKLFVSHAKMDGVPSARAIKAMIGEVPLLDKFYDVDDIAKGSNVSQVLQKAVRHSVLIVFLTDSFVSRYWCRQEDSWAEQFGSTMVVIDLRRRLLFAPSVLALDRAPCVRVPDGNFYRILHTALREALRTALLRRLMHDIEKQAKCSGRTLDIHILPRRPPMFALHTACQQMKGKRSAAKHRAIVYPDPVMPEGEMQAARALSRTFDGKLQIATPEDLLVSLGL